MDINSVLEEMQKYGVSPENIDREIAQLEEEISSLSILIDRGDTGEALRGL